MTAVTPTLPATIDSTRKSGSCCRASTLAANARPSAPRPSRYGSWRMIETTPPTPWTALTRWAPTDCRIEATP